ncbi:hypothetical protein C0J45_9900 [Silurus meridionalis]|nr:hypothetical protein C0J45_9900 [Silurus meridionalis]
MWVLTVTILLLCVAAHAAEDDSKPNNNEHHYETIDDTVPPTAAAIPIQTHTEGGNVILLCTNDGKVSWSKGVPEGRREIITAQRGETPKNHFPDHRYMMFSDFSLYIRNVSVSDSGIYYCNTVPVVNLIITPGEVGQSLVWLEPGQCPNAALGASKEAASSPGPLRDRVKIEEDAHFSFPETHSVAGLMDQVSVGAWTGQAPAEERRSAVLLLLGGRNRQTSFFLSRKQELDPAENENKFTQATLKSPTYTRLSDREHGASQTTISNPSVRGNEGSSGSRSTAIRIQTHTEGSDVVFYCNNDGKVMWSKGVPEGRREIITAQRGETPKKLHPDPDNRFMMLSDFSLYIRNVSVSDSGIYYCNAVPVVNLIITPVEENVSKTTMTSPTSSTRANHSENHSTQIISFNSTVQESEGTSSTLENVRTITQTPTTSTSVNGSEPEATQTSSSNSIVQNRKGPSVVTTTRNVSKTTMTTPTSSTRANHSEHLSTQIISFNSTVQESEGTSSTLENVRTITQTLTTSTSVNGSEPEATQTSSSNSIVQNRKGPSVVTTTPVVMVSVLGGVTAVGVFGALLLWKCFFQKKTVKDKKADHIYESMTDVTQTAGSCDGKADGRESVDGMFTMSNVLQLCVCVSLALFITAGAVAVQRVFVPGKHFLLLSCDGQSDVVWRHGGTSLIKVNNTKQTLFLDGKLEIKSLETRDSGLYYCNNQLIAHVTVLTGYNVVVCEGGTLYLPCTIPKQRWACKHTEESKKEFISTRFKNGTVIKERPDPYSRFTHMSNQLQIFNIQKLDSGTYFCSGKDVAVVNVTSAVVTLVLLLVIVFLKFSSRKKPTEGSVLETHTHDADAVTLHASVIEADIRLSDALNDQTHGLTPGISRILLCEICGKTRRDKLTERQTERQKDRQIESDRRLQMFVFGFVEILCVDVPLDFKEICGDLFIYKGVRKVRVDPISGCCIISLDAYQFSKNLLKALPKLIAVMKKERQSIVQEADLFIFVRFHPGAFHSNTHSGVYPHIRGSGRLSVLTSTISLAYRPSFHPSHSHIGPPFSGVHPYHPRIGPPSSGVLLTHVSVRLTPASARLTRILARLPWRPPECTCRPALLYLVTGHIQSPFRSSLLGVSLHFIGKSRLKQSALISLISCRRFLPLGPFGSALHSLNTGTELD